MKEFLDEFKHLEKLCNDIYSGQHGVTQYIDEMKQKSGYASGKIRGWDNDLASLIRVRHIRNKLVHETYCDIDYNQTDIIFLRDFYNRILNQQDPLSLLRKHTKSAAQAKPRPRNTEVTYLPHNYSDYKNNDIEKMGIVKGVLIYLLIIIVLITGILLLLSKVFGAPV
ncbi:MAG: hypothetical protein IJU01_05940 [Lachnospiraceae bacterium]|nr:hypothetical protein [Lachnospiraceae bacterium]